MTRTRAVLSPSCLVEYIKRSSEIPYRIEATMLMHTLRAEDISIWIRLGGSKQVQVVHGCILSRSQSYNLDWFFGMEGGTTAIPSLGETWMVKEILGHHRSARFADTPGMTPPIVWLDGRGPRSFASRSYIAFFMTRDRRRGSVSWIEGPRLYFDLCARDTPSDKDHSIDTRGNGIDRWEYLVS